MDIPVTQLPPGDPRLVEAIVGQLKSRGIFDQFRKECLADVDTKPAFQNLRQRVEGHVNKFLEKKIWKNDMNKNQLRDGVRKHVNNLGILDTGIDAIITQVVNPKIKPLILPYVEDTVYAFLQIDKPKRERKDSEPLIIPIFQEEEKKIKIVEPPEEVKVKPSLLPMETDVISSEEDDILARESPEASQKSASSPEAADVVKTEDENAQDSFESGPQYQEDNPESIVTNVERLHLSEDDSKSAQAAKPPLPLFEDQSLDSISSNSSGLTFSPLTEKGSPESKKSQENGSKSDSSPRAEVRSTTSTPLVDEKPVDETSRSSFGSNPSKEFQSSDKMYPAESMQGDHETSTPSLLTLQPSARSVKDGASFMSVDEDSLESKESFSKMSMASEKSEVLEKAKSEKSEGEITSSSSEFSDGDTKIKQAPVLSEERQHSDHDSSHKSSRSTSEHKKRRDSYSSRDRDREREKDKDSRHQREKERKHSKSRDDHHSHRDKDKKHHRRDKDHDGDRERSRGHHHQSSSSHKDSSGSSRTSGDKDKDRSSHHSSGKSSEGKSRSSHSSERSDGKPSNKMETKSDEKSDGKSQKKDESKHDKKHHGTSDRKSESKSDGKHEKRTEDKTDKKPDKKPDKKMEKKEKTKEDLESKSENKVADKPDSKSKKKTEEMSKKSEGKSNKSESDTSSKQKKHESSQNSDCKKHKKSHRYKEDSAKDMQNKENFNSEMQNGVCENLINSEKENGVCENINNNNPEHNGESQIDAHMLGLNGDNIIVADDEGNFMLLTYEDDTDSVSSDSQVAVKIDGSSAFEVPLVDQNNFEGFGNDFEGFENTKVDQTLADYLLNVVNVPDDMDMECSEWFDESDLHITLYGDNLDGKIPLSNFLKCMHQLGAVIRNDRGEIEDHSVKTVTPCVAEAKENNANPVGKKRRMSTSSSISSSSSLTGSPKHKRLRRESSAASDTSQMLEQDSVIVSGYALLTPEDDGNRTMSREYDLDYSQKMSNYSPLSPASDSSADEGKAKNRGAAVEPSAKIVKSPTKIDRKTDASWPKEDTKFSV